MTPTEREAVAKAIAALESARKRLDKANALYAFDPDPVDIALASLRAVAPAPADQSDAGRDGAIEECASWHDRRSRDTPDVFESEFHEVSAKAIRALASATSETVGRRELSDGAIYSMISENDAMKRGEPSNTELIADLVKDMTVIHSADRDAIRQALHAAKFIIKENMGAVHVPQSVYVALALLSEG